jgi:hypothetical protein
MTPLVLAGVPALGPTGCMPMPGLTQPVLAALIAVGGVLILKGHPQGPACVGLSCALLTFLPFCSDVQHALLLLGAARPGALVLLLLRAMVVYPIPALVIVWAIREEDARQAESDSDR